MAIATIEIEGDLFFIYCPYFDNERAKAVPDRRWVKSKGCWSTPATKVVAKYLNSHYKPDEFEPTALAKMLELKNSVRPQEGHGFPAWFKFKEPPFEKQMVALNKAWPHDEFAFFMDMGTGKTFTVINMAAARAMMGQIHAFLVIAPSSAKPIWPDEIEKFMPIPFDLHVHEPTKREYNKSMTWVEKESDRIKVLVVSVEALSQGNAIDVCMHFTTKYKTMVAVDESSSIKTPPRKRGQKSRTTRCWDIAGEAAYRAIMTGTEITQGIEDLYAQFRFLDWKIIGLRNFTAFKSQYCRMGGFQGKKIVGYQNVDQLMELIAPQTFQCKITECQDMPEQIYETRKCALNDVQKRLLKELGDPYEMRTAIGDMELEVDTVLERMTRYQQIVGGHFPWEDEEWEDVDGELTKHKKYRYEPIPGPNHKMEALKQIIDELPPDRKVVIYAAWQPEQNMIIDYLGRERAAFYCKRKDHKSTEYLREETRRFQNDDDCQFMVSGRGGYRAVTWTRGDIVIYYSSTFSYDEREQSERRTWRTGRKNHVLYIDLVSDHHIDSDMRKAVKRKKDVADFVKERLAEQNHT